VIGVALVLVAVVAGLRPHLVTGNAQAAPVPGPPVVGDCVLDPVPPPALPSGIITNTPVTGGTVPVYRVRVIQPCTQTRYGEITSVIATPKPTIVRGDNADGLYLYDPNELSCESSAPQYVGMTTQPIQRFWQPAVQFSSWLAGPSPQQKVAGQHWAACIVTLRPPDPISPPTTAPQYGRSIRNALHTGQQRDQLGYCVQTAGDWASGFGSNSCRQPHDLEILANGDSGDHPVSRDQLEATCRQLVRQLTAIPDPTAAGALSITMYTEIEGHDIAITPPQVPAHSNLTCGVITTGSRKLRGSLLSLGRQPIPWA